MTQTNLLLSACCAAALTTPHAWAQAPAAPQPAVDHGKRKIELAPKKLLAETAPAPRPVATDPDNPPVAPGKVTWHESFDAAKVAAARSGKPVLLFQLMGRLDRQFT